ncbi:hypothetical protein [Pedobacter sp. Leaf176]|uniref:hypothetical protein n=1 Tax=Pedobacter sp. Leaf176 TaxID=1736286 RepID=UPI0006F41201|nr:hypothetical protein [Pedobacter sp. Leaf176]KQR67287.1 hypothetical protein ASF92_16405 [Pedobacter sp. Leaf176]
MNTNELIAQLKKFVLIKSGLRNIDPANCKTISEFIFKETKNYISETTVKRFFGFAQTHHKFSIFTLNSLSQYIGYPDWGSFCKEKRNQDEYVDDVWSDLKIRCRAITDVSLIAKKNSSGVPFEATANRSFLYSDFDYFLKNNYQFTTISAQPGQGKSILLAHLVEHFFYGEDALYKKDIVLLINSGVIYEVIQNDLSLKDWFYKEFKFSGVSELITYFKKNTKELKGRFVLIVDGIDQFLSKDSNLKILTDFLYGIEENDFVKIVFGLRVNNWVSIQPTISGSAFLTNSWYKGLFFDYDQNTNVPNLNKDEIYYTLSHIEGRKIKDNDLHHGLIKYFQTPFWLQVYYKLKQVNNSIRLDNYLLCLDLTDYFLESKIFISNNSTEKIYLLTKITNAISKGNLHYRVSKESILEPIKNYTSAYHELIYLGILIEEKRLTTAKPTEIVRFLNNDIYTYFLFFQLTERYNFNPSAPFFEAILTEYADRADLRKLMLSWSVRFCIKRNEIQALKNIFKLPFSNEEKNDAFDFICDVALSELEKTGALFNAQTINMHFIDIMATGRIMSKNYKETIKKISEKVFNEDIQLILNVMECSICVIGLDSIGVAESLNILKRNVKKLEDLFPINPYDLILFLSNLLNNKKKKSKPVDDNIFTLCRQLEQSLPQKNETLTSVEIICYRLILVVLFSNKNYEECNRFISAILKKYPKIFHLRSSVFPCFLLIITAQTYIKLNQHKKAQRLIQYIDILIKNENTYLTPYIRATHTLAKGNFLNHTKNYEKALKEVEKGLALSNKHELNTIEISLRLLQINTLKHAGNIEEINRSIKDLINFLKLHKLSMPDFVNINDPDFDHMFNILKHYK